MDDSRSRLGRRASARWAADGDPRFERPPPQTYPAVSSGRAARVGENENRSEPESISALACVVLVVETRRIGNRYEESVFGSRTTHRVEHDDRYVPGVVGRNDRGLDPRADIARGSLLQPTHLTPPAQFAIHGRAADPALEFDLQ